MNVRIIIMGKTGAGKSTLVNSLLSKNVAKTGVGSAITLENQQYSLFTTFDNQQVHIDIYDTVGLELDSKKNKKTLDEAQAYIKFLPSDAISVVWYCINPNCNKFEQFELELIDELSYKYEIPFIVVLTQSWNNYCSKALINKLLIKHPELIIMSVLAEKYETDIGIIQPFGMDRLLSKSIYDYNDLKIEILDNKLNKLQKTEDEYQMLKQKAKSIVYHYSDKAFKFGCIPIVSIFSFQTLYGKMLGDIANVYSDYKDEYTNPNIVFSYEILKNAEYNEKNKQVIFETASENIELKANQVYIDLSPWMSNGDTKNNLEIIKTALEESRLISFEYANHSGNKTARTVEPYQLVLKSGHWYIQGYCLMRNDFRLFKLSRISSLQICEETFMQREYQKPLLDVTDIASATQIEIKFRIHKSIMDRVLDFCSFENFSPDGNEFYIVDFPFIENDYNFDFLLSLGDKCECLSPQHIREEMKCRIRSISKLYES